jgi:hypothetical protein
MEQLEAHQKSLTSAVVETAQTVLELTTIAKSLWITRTPQERRDFLDLILSNPILDGLTVRFELKKPFAVLLGMKENVDWCTRLDLNQHAVKHMHLKHACIPFHHECKLRSGARE